MNRLGFYYTVVLMAIWSCTLESCSEDVDIETETSISYTLTMSPDLLKFVTPQVNYIDEYGNLVTITGVEELDGKVIENSAEVNSGDAYAGSWSSVVITGTGYKCWTIQMKFKHLGFHSYMSVNYLRNDFIEDIAGKIYDFHHDINTSVNATTITKTKKGWFGGESMNVRSYADSHVSITIGDYHIGDDIEEYLKNLSDNPDRVGYFVDENGNVIRKDDF